MDFYRWEGEDLILSVHVQPRASQTAIVGAHQDRLKIRTTAAPVEGQANAEIIKLLAKSFGVAKSHVILLQGDTSRDKRFRIQSPKKLPDFISAQH
ncbi:DUF167 domain-containing protein [Beggiatoa leptomitoformis]|uniref:UPF0235 protein BLE401_07175 n=1 Tax=Beggiatoa leptomitoformis TaxID=288004 RepID=A0A2N9YDR1_9GAMM|nr:DUF167 family protein [Beggiatoa leptomitoformis]ALG69084.1 YggU family protein [Beggiatoa leptomitoformis]AUI68505.1 YggU family protein [Beggiatoa leptomitoformis]